MGLVVSSMSVSLDGFITGPNDSRALPLGEGGLRLHAWLSDARTPRDAEVLDEMISGCGAIVMGRRSYDQCEGDGGWGDGGPVGATPCFVLSHSVPDQVRAPSVFTFVADGIESAIRQAKQVAGDRVVGLHGGSAAQQALRARLLDEVQLHLVPILLGAGVRLFEPFAGAPVELERTRVVETPSATHLRYRVLR